MNLMACAEQHEQPLFVLRILDWKTSSSTTGLLGAAASLCCPPLPSSSASAEALESQEVEDVIRSKQSKPKDIEADKGKLGVWQAAGWVSHVRLRRLWAKEFGGSVQNHHKGSPARAFEIYIDLLSSVIILISKKNTQVPILPRPKNGNDLVFLVL